MAKSIRQQPTHILLSPQISVVEELDLALEIWKFINRLSIEVLRSVGEFRQLRNTKLRTSGVSKHLTHLGRVSVDAALCTSLQKL
jgi:hypothetical protein